MNSNELLYPDFELCIAVYVMQLAFLLNVFHKSFFNTSFSDDVKLVGH